MRSLNVPGKNSNKNRDNYCSPIIIVLLLIIATETMGIVCLRHNYVASKKYKDYMVLDGVKGELYEIEQSLNNINDMLGNK